MRLSLHHLHVRHGLHLRPLRRRYLEHDVQGAENLGCKNVAELISVFRRADMLDDIATFKNLMVWFACETLAQEIAP